MVYSTPYDLTITVVYKFEFQSRDHLKAMPQFEILKISAKH